MNVYVYVRFDGVVVFLVVFGVGLGASAGLFELPVSIGFVVADFPVFAFNCRVPIGCCLGLLAEFGCF